MSTDGVNMDRRRLLLGKGCWHCERRCRLAGDDGWAEILIQAAQDSSHQFAPVGFLFEGGLVELAVLGPPRLHLLRLEHAAIARDVIVVLMNLAHQHSVRDLEHRVPAVRRRLVRAEDAEVAVVRVPHHDVAQEGSQHARGLDRARPGRPIGGEANSARTLYALLKERYGR